MSRDPYSYSNRPHVTRVPFHTSCTAEEVTSKKKCDYLCTLPLSDSPPDNPVCFSSAGAEGPPRGFEPQPAEWHHQRTTPPTRWGRVTPVNSPICSGVCGSFIPASSWSGFSAMSSSASQSWSASAWGLVTTCSHSTWRFTTCCWSWFTCRRRW